MALIPQGYAYIKNAKTNIYIGRSPIEDKSNGEKSFFPLKPEEVGKNAVFRYGRGFNEKLLEFHSLKSGVATADDFSIYKLEPRPAAFVGLDIDDFYWEHDTKKDKDVIRDPNTKQVWTLSDAPDKHVSLEDEVVGDERQLWKLEEFEYTEE